MALTLNQKKILNNFNWLMGAYVYRFATGLISLAFVTRYLGPDSYGIFAYSLSVFSFIEISIEVINQEVFKKELLEADEEKKLMSTYFIFMFLASLTLILLTACGLWIFEIETGMRRVLISILSLSILFRAADTLSYYLNVKMRNDLISRAELISTTIFNGTRIGLTMVTASLPFFAAAVILQKAVNFIYISKYYLVVAKENISIQHFDLKLVADLAKKSYPLFLAGASIIVFTRVDQIMIGNLLTNSDVGLYSIVVKLSESWVFIATVLTQAVYPSLVTAYNSSISDFNHKVQKSLSILFYFSLAIIGFTILFSDILVQAISSKEYLAASPILKIHIVSLIFLFWQNLGNQYDIIVGAAKFTLFKTITASLLNIALNFYLIEKIGILGASYATIISYGTATFLLNIFYSKTRPYFFLQVKSFMFWQTKWFS